MGKYDPLKRFLENQRIDNVPVTFHEIEALLGVPLPKSKRYPAWWSNNASNNTMTRVWLDAGFVTEQVDIASERLVFRRSRHSAPLKPPAGGLLARLHAALGGTVRFAPGFDPTAPAGEPWAAERE